MEWINVITNVGVPIACMAALAGYVLKRDKRDDERDAAHEETIRTMTEDHKQEIASLQAAYNEKLDNMTAALNNNTLAISTLCERLNRS